MHKLYVLLIVFVGLFIFTIEKGYAQFSAELTASMDNSIYSESDSSNALGVNLFVGRNNGGNLRRALVKFDLSSIPPGSQIQSAQLIMAGTRGGPDSVNVHRVTAAWGEGSSLASGAGGQGANPTDGDATWNFSVYDSINWNTPGGDFEPMLSATAPVQQDLVSMWQGDGIVDDIQSWVDSSASNHGWILIGNEQDNGSAVRIASRHDSLEPILSINYSHPDSCNTLGGVLTTDGVSEVSFCLNDDQSHEISVDLVGNSGSMSTWLITDQAGMILDLPSSPPFSFEDAGDGICVIYHLSFEAGVTGISVGGNISDIQGCFALSTGITVDRSQPEGGNIELSDGSTELTICAGDGESDAFDVVLTGSNGGDMTGWVITDTLGTILGLPAAPPFDLEGAGGGVCLVWHIAYDDGLTGLSVDSNASNLMGCFDLSNPITLIRETEGEFCVVPCDAEGGSIELSDGSTELTICAGDGESDAFEVVLTGSSGSDTTGWIITDTLGTILGLPAAPPFDLEGAGGGVCLVWHIAYDEGLTGLSVDSNASNLMGCFDLSNPIRVDRVTEGGPCQPDCVAPENITASQVSAARFVVDWDDPQNAWYYTIRVRPVFQGRKRFFEQDIRFGKSAVIGAPRNFTYEYQVQTVCLDSSTSEYSDLQSFFLDGSFVPKNNPDEFNEADIMIYEILPGDMDLFPNPTADEFFISERISESYESTLRVFDLTGKLKYEEVLSPEKRIHRVNAAELSNGVYLVTLSTQGKVLQKKKLIIAR